MHMHKVIHINKLYIIYYAFAYSYLNINCIVWGGAPKTVLAPLQIAQNKIVRNIAPLYMLNSSTKEMYDGLNLLNINQLYHYRTLEFGYKWMYMSDYQMFHDEFQRVTFVHIHNTRNRDRLRIPFPRLNKHKQFIIYNFIKFYNNLPENLLQSRNFNYFKNILSNT